MMNFLFLLYGSVGHKEIICMALPNHMSPFKTEGYLHLVEEKESAIGWMRRIWHIIADIKMERTFGNDFDGFEELRAALPESQQEDRSSVL